MTHKPFGFYERFLKRPFDCILAGLALAFYVRPVALRAERQGSGSWHLYARCRRGGPMFHEAFLKAAAGAGFSAAVNAEDGTAATGGED